MLRALLLLALLPSALHAQGPVVTNPDSLFSAVTWRSIGPFRGGRSVASTGVIGDPKTYYMGTTGGGLWKTDNMGITWRNISDGFFTTATIGAIAVAPSDRNVVYVGTGEHAPRGVMTHSGDGVYRSTDAGKTWTKVGLEATRHIARIVVHPTNPDVLLVAAQGALYAPNAERGVFKSTDGGATWKRVLFVDERTGAAELSMDATNPRILYAAMWEHGRKPWQVISGGPGSGLWKSTDMGETWTKLTSGLPDKMGKMAIAVSPSEPERVYALIESESEGDARGLYVSTNAGRSWSQVTNDPRLVQRAWYYIELFVDPKNSQRIYVLTRWHARRLSRSVDQSERSGQLRHLQRRRRRHHVRRRQELEFAGRHAHGAVLSHRRRRSLSVPHLRWTTGQHLRRDRESRTRRRRHHAVELGTIRRWRKRVPCLRSGQPALRHGRQLSGHRRNPRQRDRCIDGSHGVTHPVPRHGCEGHAVSLQLERAHHLEPMGTRHVLPRRAGAAQDE
ncbi:MAG: hypothetical protein MUD17_06420 [Gemmatimonadaceae bacterium]|nr:hypothetical protein [Gemmatimonadaceae bacterium]